MANCDADYAEQTTRGYDSNNIKERLERQLAEANVRKAKLEAALRFLAANPDAQALLEVMH
jgi:hypothetical protein